MYLPSVSVSVAHHALPTDTSTQELCSSASPSPSPSQRKGKAQQAEGEGDQAKASVTQAPGQAWAGLGTCASTGSSSSSSPACRVLASMHSTLKSGQQALSVDHSHRESHQQVPLDLAPQWPLQLPSSFFNSTSSIVHVFLSSSPSLSSSSRLGGAGLPSLHSAL